MKKKVNDLILRVVWFANLHFAHRTGKPLLTKLAHKIWVDVLVERVKDVKMKDDGYYSVQPESTMSGRFGVKPAPDGYIPQVGAFCVRLIHENFVYGIGINGHKFMFDTFSERRAQWAAEREQKFAEESKKFSEYDRKVAALPAFFREYIEYNRQEDPDFRYESEGHALGIVDAAMQIAQRFGSAEEILNFHNTEEDERMKIFPEFDWLEHSTYSFYQSCRLAANFLKSEPKAEDLEKCYALCNGGVT